MSVRNKDLFLLDRPLLLSVQNDNVGGAAKIKSFLLFPFHVIIMK